VTLTPCVVTELFAGVVAIDFDASDLRGSILGTETEPFRLLEDPDEAGAQNPDLEDWPTTDFGYAYIMAARGGTAAIHPMLVRTPGLSSLYVLAAVRKARSHAADYAIRPAFSLLCVANTRRTKTPARNLWLNWISVQT
jgi:hypothetical protein